jgi:hypothetical protein
MIMPESIHVCFDRLLPGDLYRPLTLSGRKALRAIAPKKSLWPNGTPIKICFLEGSQKDRDFVQTTASQWLKYANLKFEFGDDPNAHVRVGFQQNDGAWSAVGTDCLNQTYFPKNERTLNLGWLDEGVVLHEFGHAIGLAHEHQSPKGGIQWNEPVVINALKGPPNYWSEEVTRHNVIQKYSLNQIIGTAFDPDSIMLYYFPAEWTLNGYATHENEDLSKMDKAFIASAQAYPKTKKTQDDVIVNLAINAKTATFATIGQPGEEDLFRLKVKNAGYYSIATRGKTDLVMRLFGPDNRTKLVDEDDDSGQGFNARITRNLAPGEYLVQIRHANPKRGTGEYGILVKAY